MPDDEEALRPLLVARLLGRTGQLVTSPARRCRVDDSAATPRSDERLRPWDLGSWTGQELAALPAEGLAAWRSDPAYRDHGGESLEQLAARVAELLSSWHDEERRVAVTHAAVVKAAVVVALRAPLEAVWHLDVAPASITELHPVPGGWRVVRVSAPQGRDREDRDPGEPGSLGSAGALPPPGP